MKEYMILAIAVIISNAIGFIFGHFIFKKKSNGSVVIERTEDGERERIRFVLDLELDEIKGKSQLILDVENHLSQNSQPV